MPFLFDADVVGQGAADLVGSSHVLYVATHVTTLGLGVRDAGDQAVDHILHAGWFSLGDHFSVGVELPHDWWRAPVFINFVDQLWTPEPSNDAANGPLSLQATRVRWNLGLGTDMHLSVFGI